MADNPIISFKRNLNETNVHLRERLALHANDILELRQLSCMITDEEEYAVFIIVLILIVINIKFERENVKVEDFETYLIVGYWYY